MDIVSFNFPRNKSKTLPVSLLPKRTITDTPLKITVSQTQDVGIDHFHSYCHDEEVLRMGKMQKCGLYSRFWKNRFCVLSLRGGKMYLSFYTSVVFAMERQSKGKGNIHIPKESKVFPMSVEEARTLKAPHPYWCFSILVNTRKFIFSVESVSCMENWIFILQSKLAAEFPIFATLDLLEDEKETTFEPLSVSADERTVKDSLVLTDITCETLLQTDNWEVFTAKFDKYSFKLKPGLRRKTSTLSCMPSALDEDGQNLLEYWPKERFSQTLVRKSVREIKSFLESFYGKGRVKAGWLFKRGRFNKSWKRRFCVLTHKELEYYKELKDVSPQGVIPIAEIECLSTGLTANGMKVFYLVTKDRVWNFAATDDETREDWVSSIEDIQTEDSVNGWLSNSEKRTSSLWRSKCQQNMIHVRTDSISQRIILGEISSQESFSRQSTSTSSSMDFKDSFRTWSFPNLHID